MRKNNYEILRIKIIIGIFIAVGALIIGKALYLQVSGTSYSHSLKNMYKNQATVTFNIKGERGKIIDSGGNIFAISNEVESVYINPAEIRKNEKEKLIRILSILFNEKRKTILKKVNSKKKFVWIKRKAPKEITSKLKKFSFKGVNFLKEFKRFYPFNYLASNLIGYCNIDGKGAAGVELKYDKYLKGKSFKVAVSVDARKHFTSYIPESLYERSKGDNVKLTIDFKVQSIVEKELKLWVESHKAKRGIIIVMEPRTGKIIAMASYPNFNPNCYYKFSRDIIFKNPAISYNYEPGSTVKPLIVAWALSKKLIDLDWFYYCGKGYYRYKSLDVHDHCPMLWKTVEGIIIHSSNIGMVRIANYIGKHNVYNVFEDFNFGKKTGIDLPGESKGIFPDIKRFSSVTHATMAFGQGISVTPIQLISSYCALVNGGFFMKPYVVESIEKGNSEIVRKISPTVYKRVIDTDTSKKIKEVLEKVVEKGTAVKTKLSYIKIGGKTGTAQVASNNRRGYLKGQYISSFLGFFPVENPKCVMLMVLERPKKSYYASDVVCPQFKKLSQEIMPYFGIKNSISTVLKEKKQNISLGLTKLEVLKKLQKEKIKKFKLIGSGFLKKKEKKGNTFLFYFQET